MNFGTLVRLTNRHIGNNSSFKFTLPNGQAHSGEEQHASYKYLLEVTQDELWHVRKKLTHQKLCVF